jgi:hypothetical protein
MILHPNYKSYLKTKEAERLKRRGKAKGLEKLDFSGNHLHVYGLSSIHFHAGNMGAYKPVWRRFAARDHIQVIHPTV